MTVKEIIAHTYSDSVKTIGKKLFFCYTRKVFYNSMTSSLFSPNNWGISESLSNKHRHKYLYVQLYKLYNTNNLLKW